MPEPIIRLENLNYIYNPGTPLAYPALSAINWEMYPGEIIGLIGPAGSGKSTLIQLLNGLLRPSKGRVLFKGSDIWENPLNRRGLCFKIGLVFQYPEHQLFASTVEQDIAFGPINMGLDKGQITKRIQDALTFVGLDRSILPMPIVKLSGGQKRLVALAGIMALQPEILVLDEPTAGLDPQSSKQIMSRLCEYQRQQGSSMIIVTHSLEEIINEADRLIGLNAGRIVKQSRAPEWLSDSKVLHDMGLQLPALTQLFQRLQQMGLPVTDAVYSLEQALTMLDGAKNRV